MAASIDTIRLDPAGDRVALTFQREVGNLAKVRLISNEQASALGLLLISEAPECAFNFDVTAELKLQIENAPYERAWLSVRDPNGGRTLVVGLEGSLIQEVGQSLIRLSGAAGGSGSNQANAEVFIRHVSVCYLEDAEAE